LSKTIPNNRLLNARGSVKVAESPGAFRSRGREEVVAGAYGELLQQPEIHFDRSGHGDGNAVSHAGLKLPLADGVDGIFVEAKPQAANNPNVVRHAICSDFDRQHDRSLVLRDPRIFGV